MKNKNPKFKNHYILIILVPFFVFMAGCDQQSKGFALPEGSVEDGKFLFSMLRCNECHSVADIEWLGNKDDLHVPLGGEVSRVKTYGELVTSIINPSHKIGEGYLQEVKTEEGKSKMMIYNDIITVQELIDMVTFLQAEYNIISPAKDYYPYY